MRSAQMESHLVWLGTECDAFTRGCAVSVGRGTRELLPHRQVGTRVSLIEQADKPQRSEGMHRKLFRNPEAAFASCQ